MIQPHIRAIIAATSLSHAGGRMLNEIHDHSGAGRVGVTVNILEGKVVGWDYSTSSRFSGPMENIYHEVDRSYLHLKADGDGRYSGYDHASGSHFNVVVNGKDAAVYDHGERTYTHFYG
jgi:hypothetical protein